MSVRLAEWVLLTCILVGSIASVTLAVQRAALPYQLDYEEGNVLTATKRIASGQGPYPAFGSFPYVLSPYGPVFYYVMAAPRLGWAEGFFYPRLLVLVAGMAISVLLALLLKYWGCSAMAACSFGLLFLAVPSVRGWLYLMRVDLLGIALVLGGLYCFLAWEKHWYLSIPLFTAAAFSKYTLLAVPAACFVNLILERKGRKAVRFAAGLAALGGLCLIVMQQATGGWFWFHMFETHPDPFSIVHAVTMLRPIVQIQGVIIVLSYLWVWGDLQRRKLTLPSLCLMFATLSVLTAGKQGSVENHFLEWLALLCLCAGLSYNEMRRECQLNHRVLALVPYAIGIMVVAGLPRFGPVTTMAGCSDAYEYVRNHSGERILSENVGAVAVSDKEVLISNPAVYDFLVRWSGWPDSDLVTKIEARQVDAVLLAQSIEELESRAKEPNPQMRWSFRFVRALKKHYRLVAQFQCSDAAFAYEPVQNQPLAVSADKP